MSDVDDLSDATRYSPNVFEVDLSAVADNVREVRRVLGHDRKLFAVLKGNAYGYGSLEVARTALESGADAIGLVHLREAVLLRRGGITAPILLYGGHLADPDAVPIVEEHNLTAEVVDVESAQLFSAHATRPIRVFLKVDIGYERLGIPAEQMLETVRTIQTMPNLVLEGVFSHAKLDGLSPANPQPGEAPVSPFVQWQFDRLRTALDQVEAAGIDVPVAMVASSSVVSQAPEMYLTGSDVGRLLYGVVPDVPPAAPLSLRVPFHAFRSRLVQVKEGRTTHVEYADFPLRAGMRLGVLPVGVADGFGSLNAGRVLVRGKEAPVIGQYFEHVRVDLTAVSDARAGDEVVIVGEQGDARITVDDVMSHQGMSPAMAYLGSFVGRNVRRVYLKP